MGESYSRLSAFGFSEFLLNSFEQIKKCFTVQLRMQCNECVSFVLLLVSTMKNGGPCFENSLWKTSPIVVVSFYTVKLLKKLTKVLTISYRNLDKNVATSKYQSMCSFEKNLVFEWTEPSVIYNGPCWIFEPTALEYLTSNDVKSLAD